jgi:hypothetical protein
MAKIPQPLGGPFDKAGQTVEDIPKFLLMLIKSLLNSIKPWFKYFSTKFI